VRLLLDTNALLRSLARADLLSPDVTALIVDPTHDVFVSAVSAWEIAIKLAIGKLAIAERLETWLPEGIEASSFTPLPITIEHALAVADLPLHHRDPFDRLLVAQAKLGQMALVTSDRRLAAYGIDLILC
jgi:PIN domain nuclease of toxin-antitoxin system